MAGSRKGINSKRHLPIDQLAIFGNAYESYTRGEITLWDVAKSINVTYPTLSKYKDLWYEDVVLAIGRGEIVRA